MKARRNVVLVRPQGRNAGRNARPVRMRHAGAQLRCPLFPATANILAARFQRHKRREEALAH